MMWIFLALAPIVAAVALMVAAVAILLAEVAGTGAVAAAEVTWEAINPAHHRQPARQA